MQVRWDADFHLGNAPSPEMMPLEPRETSDLPITLVTEATPARLSQALLRWPKPGRGEPTPSDAYQITRASSVNASATRAEGGTSVPRS